jgi:hypothetical protein
VRHETSDSAESFRADGPDLHYLAMPPLGPFTIQALEQAINRARQANPARGTEASLSPEVASLASLYGWMIYEGRHDLSPDLLNADEMDILSRWL